MCYMVDIITNKNPDIKSLFEGHLIDVVINFGDLNLYKLCKTYEEYLETINLIQDMIRQFDYHTSDTDSWIVKIGNIIFSNRIIQFSEIFIAEDIHLFLIRSRFSDLVRITAKQVYSLALSSINDFNKISEIFKHKNISERVLGVSIKQEIELPSSYEERYISDKFLIYNKNSKLPVSTHEYKLDKFLNKKINHPITLTKTDNIAFTYIRKTVMLGRY